jgi:predicted acylesterase/phospholipase RssA
MKRTMPRDTPETTASDERLNPELDSAAENLSADATLEPGQDRQRPIDTLTERTVGVALSGGGFRAAAYHLGVLKRLEELAILPIVEAMSTVSGGSITGGLYALRCAEQGDGRPGSYPVERLIAEMRPFLIDNLRARAMFGSPIRALRTFVSVLSRRVSRVGLMVDELDRQLFGKATLNQLPPWIVVNATNLRTGKGWKFYCDRAGDFLVGATDKTDTIRVAEAVAASAAYPGLTDSFAFTTRWEDLRGDLLDENRWDRPTQEKAGGISRWRARFGKPSGAVLLPLVDGGLYDNEGIGGLRSRGVTHAIISAVAPPENDDASGFSPKRYLRIVEVIHDRLGAATRQLAHEMTHGVHPTQVREATTAIAAELRTIAGRSEPNADVQRQLEELAARVDALGAVGVPPRGHQFRASAQVLLHRTDVANNDYSAASRGGYDIPAQFRGLEAELVAEISRVRTDLDALEPEVLDLLIAQGYFLTDFFVKLTMPDLLAPHTAGDLYAGSLAPMWETAHVAILTAGANRLHTRDVLRGASRRHGMIGRVAAWPTRMRYRLSLAIASVVSGTIVMIVLHYAIRAVAHLL